ncbi:hypothetical protein HK104_003272 [Borealophlyctis nickersoniae]|nr:hypothetical protein HK104_003272 [Borealophlyctis nickersoniae]
MQRSHVPTVSNFITDEMSDKFTNVMSDIESIVSECKRLLTNLGEEEARAAAAAWDLWLSKHQKQRPTVKSGPRIPSKGGRVPLEIVLYILRNIRGDGKDQKEVLQDQKRKLLACRLVNRQWREIAWGLFWYRVHVPTADHAVQKLLHPWAVDALHGIQVRALDIKGNLNGLGPLLGAPWMGGIRILTLSMAVAITRSQLLMVFENLPNLISLRAMICSHSNDPDQHTMRTKEELLWLTRQKKEDEIWRRGFGNLKALVIQLEDISVALDLLGRMAVSTGLKMESLDIGISVLNRTLPEGLDSLISKIGKNCRNLKSFTALHLTVTSIRSFIQSQLVYLSLWDVKCDELMEHIIGTCVNLKYLELLDCPGVAEALQYLAKGPFLYGSTIDATEGLENQDALLSFLTKRGSSLRTLAVWQSGQDDRWFQSVAKAAPNLRQLAMYQYMATKFTSEGIIAFFHLAKKLKDFQIDPYLTYGTEVSKVANAMGIFFGDYDVVFPNYAQSMEDDWIGV